MSEDRASEKGDDKGDDNTDDAKKGADANDDQFADDAVIDLDDHDLQGGGGNNHREASGEDDAVNAAIEAAGDAAEGSFGTDEEGGDDGGDEGQNKHVAKRRIPKDGEHAIVKCTTTAGEFTMHLHREWSPHGYDRATTLFEKGYYDGSHFFRVVKHFLVQFGISYTTDQGLQQFADSTFPDDPKRTDPPLPFREGMVSYAGSGPNSRNSQLFISYDRATNLGTSPWETPIGEVVEGMESTIRNLYSEYGDMPPWGNGPKQGPIRNHGAVYIEEDFPKLDKFLKCDVKRMHQFDKEHMIGEGEGAVTAKVKKIAGTIRASAGKKNMDVTSPEPASALPVAKLLMMLGFVAAFILGAGFLARKKKKRGKSV